ncbi:MAG TPA: sensor histidine kinase [Gemmatimonadaceae bacterium]|nr:sensor histidine kinase [Gemmatimonadaceae bacterium]
MPDPTRVLIAGDPPAARLRRAFEAQGHRAALVPLASALDAAEEGTEAVVVSGSRSDVLAVAARLKTRFQMPLLPVVALAARPARPGDGASPDVWLPPRTRARDVVERVEELVRIRRTERELVRLNGALAELAAENGRLYDRARRDAEATALLLRELQHRVRNNLAAIQALLVLERHRVPPRPLGEALDVAIARLRGMAALQDSLLPHEDQVDLATLAHAVARGALDVFGAAEDVRVEVDGTATLPSRSASAVAIVLNELITNALKHAAARTVRIEIRDTPGRVELVVSDDGRGMTAPTHGGSGLMIVRAVVRNELAGELAIEPVGIGTRVKIEFPRGSGTKV